MKRVSTSDVLCVTGPDINEDLPPPPPPVSPGPLPADTPLGTDRVVQGNDGVENIGDWDGRGNVEAELNGGSGVPTDEPGVRAAIKGLLFESVCPMGGELSRSRVVGTDDME